MVTCWTVRRQGAALIVLLAVVAMLELGVLASFRLASLAVRRSAEAELKFRLRAYKTAIESYRQRFGRYPARLEELLVLPPNPRLLRRLYADPLCREGSGYARFKTVQTDDGNLINNVVSTSTDLALDGSRYDQWHYDEKLRFVNVKADSARGGGLER